MKRSVALCSWFYHSTMFTHKSTRRRPDLRSSPEDRTSSQSQHEGQDAPPPPPAFSLTACLLGGRGTCHVVNICTAVVYRMFGGVRFGNPKNPDR